jgi:hypothetical protein
MGKIRSVRAAFEAFLLDRDGQPCSKANERTSFHEFPINEDSDDDAGDLGWCQFIKRTTLEKDCVFDLMDTSHLHAPSWSYMTTQTIKNYLTALFGCRLQILGLILVAC